MLNFHALHRQTNVRWQFGIWLSSNDNPHNNEVCSVAMAVVINATADGMIEPGFSAKLATFRLLRPATSIVLFLILSARQQ